MNRSSSPSSPPGNVFWITGLAGSGKTTLGKMLFHHLREQGKFAVFLDGDSMRAHIASDLGYSREDREACAMRYAGLCKLLSEQGVQVICSTISMFHSCRNWSRREIPGYHEIYVKVPIEELKKRNQKNLYKDPAQKDIAGVDLSVEEPQNPDLVLENSGESSAQDSFEKILRYIDQARLY